MFEPADQFFRERDERLKKRPKHPRHNIEKASVALLTPKPAPSKGAGHSYNLPRIPNKSVRFN